MRLLGPTSSHLQLTHSARRANEAIMIKRGNAVAAALALNAAVWMGACGGNDSSNSATLGLSGGSPDDIQKAYCDKFAKELCAARTKCCTNLPPDGAFSCEQSVSIDCALSTSTELHDGWVFSSERIDATIQRLQTAAANCSAYRLPGDDDPFAQREVAIGGSCVFGSTSEPCAKGLGCVGSECTALLAEGAACSNSSTNPCASGLYCNRGVCASVGAKGEACGGIGAGSDGGCAAGLSCVPTDTNAATNGSVCAGPQAAGEPCNRNGDCASRSCPSNLCVACTTDASCGAGGRCTAGECTTVFDYCGADPSYYMR
jgi:hypothetical protein